MMEKGKPGASPASYHYESLLEGQTTPVTPITMTTANSGWSA